MNLKSFGIRALIAFVFGPLIILAALYGGYYLLFFVLLVVVLSLYEFFKLAQIKGAHGQLIIGEIAALALTVTLYFHAKDAFFYVLMLAFVAIFFVELYRKKASPTLNIAVTLFGAVYFSFMFGSFLLIRELPRIHNLDYRTPGEWLVMMILVVWICDTAAYLVGSRFGKHRLIRRVSPKKSIEGAVAGFVFAVLTAYVCHIWFVDGLRWIDSLVIGALVGIFSQYGDLFESLIKRDVGVKDSSSLIPEHGGIMDRFDSLTITAPVIYLYLKLVVLP